MAKNITRTVEGFKVTYGKIKDDFSVEVKGTTELYEIKNDKVEKEFKKLVKDTPDENAIILKVEPFTMECSVPLVSFVYYCKVDGTVNYL